MVERLCKTKLCRPRKPIQAQLHGDPAAHKQVYMSETRELQCCACIKFAPTLGSLNQFSMLVLYKKINSNIADFLRYVTNLAITKHVNLILGDFNKDSLLNER